MEVSRERPMVVESRVEGVLGDLLACLSGCSSIRRMWSMGT